MAGDGEMRVLVCGSRSYTLDAVMPALFAGLSDIYIDRERIKLTVIHGGAEGADSLGGNFARNIGAEVIEYPADWKKHGKAAGPIRNQQMLDEGKPDCVIAFVDRSLELSRGTADMVRRAEKAELPVWIIERRGV